jgi:hypothetical protein
MARLQTVSKALVEELKAAPEGRQRAAMLTACDFAISAIGPLQPQVSRIYTKLKLGVSLDEAEFQLLERTRDAHDDLYLELQESGDPQHMKEFSLARTMSALRFAAAPTSFASAADAIYEASCVDEDRVKFVQAVFTALRGA